MCHRLFNNVVVIAATVFLVVGKEVLEYNKEEANLKATVVNPN